MMMQRRWLSLSLATLLVGITFLGCSQCTQKDLPLNSEKAKVSYAIGQNIGRGMKMQKLDIDVDVMAMSIRDALSDKESRMTQDEMRQTMIALQQKNVSEQKELAEKNKTEGDKFLAENKKKKDIKTTASGLQYKVLKAGKGKSPSADDTVKVHYRGTLINGTEFDSSYKRDPAEFRVKGVIKGWTEALQLMKPSAKWKLFIPANLAYGPQGRPSIPPNSVLIFDVELLEVTPAKAAPDKKQKK
jgi:FKBP-type peptidyl-prolyl cis-trans isomerase